MRVLVSEYVCGGAWPDERIETSLAREGRAMLTALVADLAKRPDVQVVTTWDARLGECPLRHCDVRVVTSPTAEMSLFRELLRDSGAVWVIAPETSGVLESRRRLFDAVCGNMPTASRPRWIGPTADAIALCSDKLALSEHLRARGIATPQTTTEATFTPPFVIKPRDGAGSQDTYLVQSASELAELARPLKLANFIHQPFIAGRALSVALLIAEDGSIRNVLPVAEQHLSDDGRFQYLGGCIPARISNEATRAVQRLAEQACRTVPGLTGYVGCDLVLPDTTSVNDLAHGQPVLIEINPRLTSSYLGYRQLTDGNIPTRLLDTNSPPLHWRSEPITFRIGASLSR